MMKGIRVDGSQVAWRLSVQGSSARVAATAGVLLMLWLAWVVQVNGPAGPPVTHGPVSSVPGGSGLRSLPPALQAVASSAVGASTSRYALSPGPHGAWRAAGGGISATFSPGGPTLVTSRRTATLRVIAVGVGGRLSRLPIGRPVVLGNRVIYRRGGVSEWYRNGPLGLEQGFTLARQPSAGRGWLTVSERFAGLTVARGPGSTLLLTDRRGGPVLRYGDLSASDAAGRTLPARLVVHGRTVLLRVDTTGARFPVTVDPMFELAQLTPSGESGNGVYGGAVAISRDGRTALIGAGNDNGGIGAVWVFTRTNTVWTQLGPKLTPNDESGSGWFGTSVALSSNGTTALIGAGEDNGGAGAAWVFTRSGSTWTQQGAKLTPSDETGIGRFGSSVALSDNGATAMIGAWSDNSGAGAAWPFTRSGSTWSQQGPKLVPNNEAAGWEGTMASDFGSSTALSSDGNTALIGGPGDASGYGAAWLYTRAGGTWTQGGKLAPDSELGDPKSPDPPAAFAGDSVALSGDGRTALIGGPQNASSASGSRGAAWAFTQANGWAQDGPAITPDVPEAAFGTAMALSTDGMTAAISGPDIGKRRGEVWLFANSGGEWGETATQLSPSQTGTEFGSSVALSGDSNTLVIGAPGANSNAGTAWLYANSDLSVTVPASGSSSNDTRPTFSGTAGGSGPPTSVTVDVYSGAQASSHPRQILAASVGSTGSFSVPASAALRDGVYTVQAHGTESSGYVEFSPPVSFTVDTIPPVPTLTVPANGGWTRTTTPSFSGTAGSAPGDAKQVTVTVYTGSSASGSPFETLTATRLSTNGYAVRASPALSDGVYTAQATQTDAAGNTGTSSANTFTVDTVAPVVSLTAPASGQRVTQSRPAFTGTAGAQPGDQSTVTVTVYPGTAASGTPYVVLHAARKSDGSYSVQPSSALPDGRYAARTTQMDTAGNVGFSAGHAFRISTVPAPTVTLTTPPNAGATNEAKPTFGGTASHLAQDATSVTVDVHTGRSLSGTLLETLTASVQSNGAFSVKATTALADGAYTAQARQTDAGGDTGLSRASVFTVDTVKPVVTITSPASGSVDHYRSPSFGGGAGTASGDAATVTVTVYPGSSASGTPVETLSGSVSSGHWSVASAALSNGTYTVRAQQRDLAGNIGSAQATFTLDATPPHTTISAGPPNPSGTSSASFTFFSSVENSTFSCKLDTGAWTSCSSPSSYSGLQDGSHTFSVRATDPWGNTDPQPASYTWTIDTSAPDTAISSGPSGVVAARTASFTFFASTPGSTFACSLDAKSWAACSSPASYSGLANGQHTFRVRATDPFGRTDATPASDTWTVQVSAPDTALKSAPKPATQSRTAVFRFSSSEAPVTFECRLDGSRWRPCTSPVTYVRIKPGRHTFSVRATTAAGADPTPSSVTWTVGALLLRTGMLDVVAGTFSGHRIVAPALNLTTRTAAIGVAFCSAGAKRACRLGIGLTSAGHGATGRPPVLGSRAISIQPGRNANVELTLIRGAASMLGSGAHVRARVIFTVAHRRPLRQSVSLAVHRRR